MKDTIVRCKDGHLSTTIWVRGVSFKSVRLGSSRYQRCPVGHHWATVQRVDPEELSEEQRQEAAAHRDLRIP